jgi:hypothetical protein
MKPSEIKLANGVSALPMVFGRVEREFAAALLIWRCRENGDEWKPASWPMMQSFIVSKIDAMSMETLGNKGETPVWFEAGVGIRMWPDFKWLVDNGYLKIVGEDGELGAQELEPTQKFFDACAGRAAQAG